MNPVWFSSAVHLRYSTDRELESVHMKQIQRWWSESLQNETSATPHISRPESLPCVSKLWCDVPVCSSWVRSASLGLGGQVWHTPVATGLDASSLGGDLAGWPFLVLSTLLFSSWRPCKVLFFYFLKTNPRCLWVRPVPPPHVCCQCWPSNLSNNRSEPAGLIPGRLSSPYWVNSTRLTALVSHMITVFQLLTTKLKTKRLWKKQKVKMAAHHWRLYKASDWYDRNKKSQN